MTEFQSYRYWAFISYSSANASVAKRLHGALEMYRLPRSFVGSLRGGESLPRRLFPVFRDRDELPLSADLGGSIQDALAASRYLVVLCSPHAARSRWVNEEVRFFKSLGRADRILAIIVSGEPNAVEKSFGESSECFPPALRYAVLPDGSVSDRPAEPIAGDLRPGGDGWHAVLLKTVAGVTGLGFDALAQRDRARRRRRQIVATIMSLLLLAGGLLTVDYLFRTKVEHFSDLLHRYGIPEGVQPLSKEEASWRQFHYVTETLRGRVRRVSRVHSQGTLQGDAEWNGGATIKITYREDGSLSRIDAYDRAGRLVMRKSLTEVRPSRGGGGEMATVTSENFEGFAAPSDSQIGLLQSANPRTLFEPPARSTITTFVEKYGPDGLVRRIEYRTPYGMPARNEVGQYGLLQEHDANGNTRGVTGLDAMGSPCPDRQGVTSTAHLYDSRHNCSETRYLEANDRAVAGDGFFAVSRRKFDASDNVIREEFYGVQGEPVLNRDGYHRCDTERDRHGNPIAVAYLGLDGKPTLDRSGVALIRNEFDAAGNLVSQAYRDVDAHPTNAANGASRLSLQYDGRGKVVERRYQDHAGQLTLGREGFAVEKSVFDIRGLLRERTLFDEHSRTTLHGGGYARFTCDYDDSDRLERIVFYGVNGSPGLATDRFAETRLGYDERGNVVRVEHRDGDGELVSCSLGYARMLRTYDDRGSDTAVALQDPTGKPALCVLGFAGFSNKYDHMAQLVERTFVGEDGRPVVAADGYAAFTCRYDSVGNCAETRYFDASGKPCLSREGFAGTRDEYDSRGNRIKQTYLDLDGRPMMSGYGYASFVSEHDAGGKVVERTHFDIAGKPILTGDGFATVRFGYDAWGNRTETTFVDPEGKPCVSVAGYARRTAKYSGPDVLVSEVFSDAAGRQLKTEVVITACAPGGRGEKAGLKPGDVVVEYGGIRIGHSTDLMKLTASEADAPVTIRVRRGDAILELEAETGRLGVGLADAMVPDEG
jgi:YD repeat-containing protein